MNRKAMVKRVKQLSATLVMLVAAAAGEAAAADESLVGLAEQKQFDRAIALVDAGADVSRTTADGTTALHWAAYYGNLDLARRLLRAEADADVRNDYGSTPLGEAAAKGDLDMIALLLEAGADVESANPEGQTALMAVARTGNIAAAELLLGHGANVNAVEGWGGQTALHWAAARQHADMVNLLITEGANVEARAIDRNWERQVTSEPRMKDMKTGGLTPLLYAVRENCIDCVKALLDAGADINKPDPDNVSPLILALLNLRYDIAMLLIERGADINQWDFYGRTPLYAAVDTHLVVGRSNRGDLPSVDGYDAMDVAKGLLENGANPNLSLKLYPPAREIVYDRANDFNIMNTGATPIQQASYMGDIEMMKLLLSYGADWKQPNIFGVTPMIALTSRSTNENTRGYMKTELDVMQALDVLMSAGADINQNGGVRGETPLHTSARMNWQTVVSFLVENGADLFARDNNGLIPLDYATGKADSQSLGAFDVIGELPEMAALLRTLMDEHPQQR
jgi:ankyrin repeat protein